MVGTSTAVEIVIGDFSMGMSIFVCTKRPYCALIRTGKLNQEEKLEAEAEKSALAMNVSLSIAAESLLTPRMKSATVWEEEDLGLKRKRGWFKGQ